MVRSLELRKPMLSVIILSVLILGVSHASAADRNTEGDAWLRMSPDARSVFLMAYTGGLSRGFAEGCLAYDRIAKPKNYDVHKAPLGKCLNRGRGFSRSVDYYVKQVTQFYESFPSDRTVEFHEVIKKLSDSESMTARQMHEWFEEHGHRK
jgi:hypothetical protein